MYADLIRDITRREKIRLALKADVLIDPVEEMLKEPDAEAADEANPAPFFRQTAAFVQVPVVEAALLLPSGREFPFSGQVPFRDRLGLFLGDFIRMPAGTYPQPDDETIKVYSFATFPATDEIPSFRVHARNAFHGKPKYSFVEVDDGTRSWFARVWMLFTCTFHGQLYSLALVSHMTPFAGPHNTMKRTFTWYSSHLDVLELGHIRRLAIMVPSFMPHRARDTDVFHLLHTL